MRLNNPYGRLCRLILPAVTEIGEIVGEDCPILHHIQLGILRAILPTNTVPSLPWSMEELSYFAKKTNPEEDNPNDRYNLGFIAKSIFGTTHRQMRHQLSMWNELMKNVSEEKIDESVKQMLLSLSSDLEKGGNEESLATPADTVQSDDPSIVFYHLLSNMPDLDVTYYKRPSVTELESSCLNHIEILRTFIKRTSLRYDDAIRTFHTIKKKHDFTWCMYDAFLMNLLLVYDASSTEIERQQCNMEIFRRRAIRYKEAINGQSLVLHCIAWHDQLDEEFFTSAKVAAVWTFAYHNQLAIPPDFYFFETPDSKKIIPALGPFMAALAEQNPIYSALFKKLMEKFYKVSLLPQIDDVQKRSLETFFQKHYEKILLLTKIMGEAAFKWLSDQLANTVLPLERLLNNLPNQLPEQAVVLLTHYFEENNAKIMNGNLNHWQNILLVLQSYAFIVTITKIDPDDIEMIDEYNSELNRLFQEIKFESLIPLLSLSSLELVSREINKHILEFLLNAMQLPIEIKDSIDADRVLSVIPSHLFSLLMQEKLKMIHSPNSFATILDELIMRFLTNQNIDDFLHDPNSVIGQHNQRIQERLRSAGINPSTALQYRRKKEFHIYETAATQAAQLEAQTKNLVTYLHQLIDLIQKPPISTVEDGKIKQQLSAIQNRHHSLSSAPSEKAKWDHFQKIHANIVALLRNPFLSNDDFRSFHEFGRHFIDQYESIVKQKNEFATSTSKAAAKKAETFVIEQWDKHRIETLFLGNEVECCLAAGGTQFPAILQRIMDDAMLFHVVSSKTTRKPVALSWLYLAEDVTGKIYIVANFLEIKAKYGVDESSRKAIIDELLRFTGDQWLSDNPKISGFLINELLYGWNKDKLSALPAEVVPITDKVGGALRPDDQSSLADEDENVSPDTKNCSATCSIYYLASLARPELRFHAYSSHALGAQVSSDITNSRKLSQTSMFKQAKTTSTDTAKQKTEPKPPEF